jgi:hypothetical protein
LYEAHAAETRGARLDRQRVRSSLQQPATIAFVTRLPLHHHTVHEQHMKQAHHYFDERDQPLPEWDGVWSKLDAFFGSDTPPHQERAYQWCADVKPRGEMDFLVSALSPPWRAGGAHSCGHVWRPVCGMRDATLEDTMAAALELIVVPAILLTLIALLLLKTSFGAAGIVATVVFLGLLYFVIVTLLRTMRRLDHDQQVSSFKAFKQAEREGEQAEREAREQLEREAEQAERNTHHPA